MENVVASNRLTLRDPVGCVATVGLERGGN